MMNMSADRKNKRLYAKQAEILKALAHPVRVGIANFLKGGPQCVCDIAEYVGSERSNVSRHLSVMASAGIVDYYKDGLKVMYQLKRPCVLDFFQCVTRCLREQAKDDRELLKAL
jgi:ArsR family transcriptional regulator